MIEPGEYVKLLPHERSNQAPEFVGKTYYVRGINRTATWGFPANESVELDTEDGQFWPIKALLVLEKPKNSPKYSSKFLTTHL